MAHAAGKLGAAVEGMEKATVNSEIDRCNRRQRQGARRHAEDDYKRGLAQEIQDHVAKMYEACDFRI